MSTGNHARIGIELDKFNSYSSSKGPPPVGPYSAVVEAKNPNRILFIAGQLPMTSDGNIVSEDIKEQTKTVLENLKNQLDAANCTFQNVVKTTVFLKNMDHFQDMNTIYSEFFADNTVKPARAAVEVSRLPKDALVEIEAIAID